MDAPGHRRRTAKAWVEAVSDTDKKIEIGDTFTDSNGRELILLHVDTSDNFHPYECNHDDSCMHCAGRKTDTHDPVNCALCRWDDDEWHEKRRQQLAAIAERHRLMRLVAEEHDRAVVAVSAAIAERYRLMRLVAEEHDRAVAALDHYIRTDVSVHAAVFDQSVGRVRGCVGSLETMGAVLHVDAERKLTQWIARETGDVVWERRDG